MNPDDRPHTTDWTPGPAKWAAVVVLGVTSTLGLAWTIASGRALPGDDLEPVRPSTRAVDTDDTPSAGVDDPADTARALDPSVLTRVNVNTASAAELETLPGIGPKRAADIIQDRESNGPYRSVDDMQRVKGIGPRTVEKLRELVRVE